MLRVKEVQEMFDVDRTTVYNWIKTGLPSYKVGGSRRFKLEEVKQWATQRTKGALNVKTPFGYGKFVGRDREAGTVTVEMDWSYLVVFKEGDVEINN
jgi:excisionase family DNA binding protein